MSRIFSGFFSPVLFSLIISISQFYNSANAQEFWSKISNIYPGHVNELQIDQDYMYAATYNGLFYSTDKGINWIEIDNQEFSGFINTDILLINDNVFLISTNGKGFFKSTDSGNTWVSKGNIAEYIEDLEQDYDGNIYAATDDQIYKSTDLGETWFKSSTGIIPSIRQFWTLYASSRGNIIAGSECGLFVSSDKGENWMLIESFHCGDITAIACIYNDDEIIIGGDDRFMGLYLSSDDGMTWNYIENPDTVRNVYTMLSTEMDEVFIGCRENTYRYYRIDNSIHQINSNLIFGGIRSFALDSTGYLYCSSNAIYKSILHGRYN